MCVFGSEGNFFFFLKESGDKIENDLVIKIKQNWRNKKKKKKKKF